MNPFTSPTSPPWIRDIPGDIRNFLLVGAALIATVTFQAGISPPGGVWQANDLETGQEAGRAVYSDQTVAFHIFLICNTMALTSSTFLLLCLTFGCPYFLEVLIAAVSMMGTYGSGIQCIAPDESVYFSPHLHRCSGTYCDTVCYMGSTPSTKVMVQATAPAQHLEVLPSILRSAFNKIQPCKS
ncbi:hypothetical protein OIU84_015849 [Salix udensis]|uniref:PGG domain-containing protein n=1 Tax=Salix udensis TaxID=889485 RepID=A0AAD6J856_9ROSI|nr:hypothetical protein OIU84_015849 [Salix udensis]